MMKWKKTMEFMDIVKKNIFLTIVLAICHEVSSFGPSHQPEAYFNGSSYLRLQTIISLKKQTGLSFRTCYGGNLFSQQLNDDLIELSVNSDEVGFEARTGGKKYEHKILGNFLNNKWHTVYLQYVSGNLTIEVDGNIQLLANSTYRNELLVSPGLYNEGAAVLLIGKQFNGCLLEGPTVVFDPNLIKSNHNVLFKSCPIPYDSCVPKGLDWCETEPCMRHGTCLSKQDTYTCLCNPRYSGKNCEIDLGNPCDKVPPICKNSAVNCTSDQSGDFTCTCSPGFTGKRCETKLKTQPLCKNKACLNGGVCDVNPDTEETYCRCKEGFEGENCEIDQDECLSNPCLNDGICLDSYNNFTCNCNHTGYEGRICDKDVNECKLNPCSSQGTCFNTYGSYLCQCLPGFGGRNCRSVIDECLSKPCQNNGMCISHGDRYECRCINGYLGTNCEIEPGGQLRQCDSNSCPFYAECKEVTGGGSVCVCKPENPGEYPDCNTSTVCSRNPCLNGGTCTPYKGSFNCTCPNGFTGKICQTNVDECASSPCQNGGTCYDRINGFLCNCTESWMGHTCEKPYDICELGPCKNNATCISSSNKRDFTCRCLSGFEGETCEVNIDDCVGNKCPPAKICIDLVNDYECRCPPGFSGDDCSIGIDPCAQKPCHNGTCLIDKNTHEIICNCYPGYTGTLCKDDIDECKESDNKICNHGICVNFEGSFQCYCKPGYTGEHCNLDFDECLSMPCKNNATCINLVNNFECRCPPGYDGKDCSLNIDECESNPCMHGATCIDGINEFTCVCPEGLTGKQCEINIDDCESSPCLHGSQCIDGLNSYTCNCTDTGYEGLHCENNIDDCQGDPCQNGAPCIDLVKDYTCKCYPGYKGKNCEVDINECESNPCQHNGTCIERSNVTLYSSEMSYNLPERFSRPFNYSEAAGYECICVPGVTGQNCEININECESNPCFYGTCTDKIGGYVCECEEGYEGIHCELDIDECEKYKPCVNGTCIDRVANYFCQCTAGYGGKNCSVELTGCMDNPCLNEGQCRPYLINETEHKFNCTCPNGFHGYTCEQITTMSFSAVSSVTVNTTREEGYDIQFRFKTTLGDGLLALGKGLTYYILELSKGRLNLHSSLLNKWEGVFTGSNLNNSDWQKVFVAINSSHLVLSANEEQTIYPISYNENNNVSSTSFPVTYIGGIPNNLRKLTHGQPFLVGCTEDVLVNSQWVLPQLRNATWLNFQNVEEKCIREPQCTPNPCESGGHCTDRWRDFSCTCERPYLGHTCQYNYTAATFGYENITDSLVTVDVADYARRAVRSIVDISMFIRTRQSRGQIFYLGSGLLPNPNDETYIAAQLEGGELLVRIQFEGNLESYTVGGVKLDNGWNHLIKVIRNVTLVQVKLNNTEYFRKTISASGPLDVRVLYLGGQPQSRSIRQANENLPTVTKINIAPTAPAAISSPLSNVHFKGIIQDVQISNGSSVMIVEFYPLQAQDLDVPASFGNVTFDRSTILKGVYSDDLCRTNPCHRGECKITWNDYMCVCPIGFKGKDCNELEFCKLQGCPTGSECKNLEDGYECITNSTFNGLQKPLQYHLTIDPSADNNFVYDSLELNYRTRSWGTVLFAKHKESYFTIFIYHNEVVIEWNLNGMPETKRFRKDRFKGQWISLLFLYKNQKFRGGFKEHVMDESSDFEVKEFDIYTFTEVFKDGDVYVGGSDGQTFDYQTVIDNTDTNMTGYIPVSDTTTAESLISNSLESNELSEDVLLYKVDQDKKTDNFKGCLGELRIGGLLLPYFHTLEIYPNNTNLKKMYELKQEFTAEQGCILCYSVDCLNKGVCLNSTETYKCHCQPGYTGDDCSIDINECENNQCQNNATCVDLINEYKCECLAGYEGEYCETDIDECLSNPCRHGGTCNDLIGTFKCDCPEGFVGKQCEAPLLITCENKPCKEPASCVTGANETTGNNFTCICTEGMGGPLCDTPFCVTTHCDQGFCNDSLLVPFCECQRGFEGKYCEININECILPNGGSPCQNRGVCIDGINRYICNCENTGYTGLLCEIDIDECQNGITCGRAGVCENSPGSYRCVCEQKGKCGHQCELDDPCETIKPCQNGICHPQCTDKPDYFCVCPDNYEGKNCTKLKVAASQAEGGINILYIVLPIAAAILIGAAAVLAVFFNVARSKRATRGTYSPSAQEFCNPRVELDHVLKPPPEERLI
ncbi:protein crumbs [Diabrotica undecimpunctata]|uniref:protein crumbs n=1 Tax=Diabrotica undecimpunctata TaxID=50387 RepID=UPI003B631DEC